MKKHIPNALTCCNLISGCAATIFAVLGVFIMSFLSMALTFIVIGAVFDFFDGMSARLLHVSSPIGKELDSLADVVTFGVAPATMLCVWIMLFGPRLPMAVNLLPLLMAAFSALRLAKFNLDERQTMGFIGLPTPANALFWGGLIVGWGPLMANLPAAIPSLLVLMLLSCYLLVAEIPMFALKFKTWGWQGNQVKWLFLLASVVLYALLLVKALPIIIACYVVLSIILDSRQKSPNSQL